MSKRTVNHDNFSEALLNVKAGKSTLYIPTTTHITKIDKRAINSFEKAGYTILSKDNDGKGFRLQSGKQKVYIFAGQLVEVSN